MQLSGRDIYLSCDPFVSEDFKGTEYVGVLGEAIEEFKILFA